MTEPFVMPEPGRRSWVVDPEALARAPNSKGPARRVAPPPTPVGAAPSASVRSGTQRQPRLYTHAGRTLTTYQWAEEPEAKAAGLDRETVRGRLRNGWSVLAAITTPKMPTRRHRRCVVCEVAFDPSHVDERRCPRCAARRAAS